MCARWLPVVVAALAMVATLPGRTHGLGLITEPLLEEFQLDRVLYASMNLWATLLGALFCLPWGWLLDRCNIRFVLAATLATLAFVVGAMSHLAGPRVVLALFLLILLTRGLGQSALSVVSLTLVGREAGQRSGYVIGVYSFVTALGFSQTYGAIRHASVNWGLDWRSLWAGIGWVLAGFAVAVLLCPRLTARLQVCPKVDITDDRRSYTLSEALRTPAFWIFALATSYYGMLAAGISLFNESILRERGFDREVFLTITTFSPLVGLASNLATGWLAERWPLPRLLALAMGSLMTALAAFPHVDALHQVYAYAAVLGAVGGMITTLFFAVWSNAYGPTHLGKIQGAAQMCTVAASAVGPLILASCYRWTGSYVAVFQYGAAAAGVLGAAAWWTPMPGASGAESPAPQGGVLLAAAGGGEEL